MTALEFSNAQSLMLAGQRLCADSPLYNMAFRFDLRGALDTNRLRQAILSVLEQQPCLRTQIDAKGKIELRDFGAADIPLAEGEPGTALEHQARATFDLTQGCFASAIYRVSEQHHVWFVKKHHLVTDGASFANFFQAVAATYANRDPQTSVNSFATHVAQQAKLRGGTRFGRAHEYWQSKCHQLDAVPAQSHRRNDTERSTVTLSDADQAALDDLARSPELKALSPQLGAFALIGAALMALRYRLFDPAARTLGMPLRGSSRAVIGPTLEIGFVDVDVAAQPSFLNLAQAVLQDALNAMKHSVSGATSAAANQRFNWLLNYVADQFGDFADLDCSSQWLHPGAGDAAHELRVQAHDFDRRGTLTLHFDAATRTFDSVHRAALPQLFLQLLRAMLNDPQADFRVATLGTPSKQPADPAAVAAPLLTQFAHQVNERPNTVAVASSDDGARLTFAELDQAANALTHRYPNLEFWPLLLPRSVEAVVVMLAALKAGRPFVPMEVDHPPERLLTILKTLDTRQAFTRLNLPGIEALNVDLNARAEAPNSAPADDAAYIIFTSGTSGTPKGVVVEPTSIANYIAWAARTYANDAPLRMPLYSSLAFDLTLTSILLPLATGGCVTTYAGNPGASQLSILEVVQHDQYEGIKLTPSHLRLILSGEVAQKEQLRFLILGGEDLPRSLAEEAIERLGNIEIYNEYGPTEATVGCMIHRFDGECDLSPSVPIGQPIDGAQIELQDYCGQPTPAGFDGELVLDGVIQAQGYFKGEAIKGQPYLSGDRARRLADGNYLYLGRLNSQVKFRGARIELAEIDNALRSEPSVADCYVAMVNSSESSEPQLCGECGIADNVPRIALDAEGVCNVCRDFEAKKERMQPYFRTLEELQVAVLDRSAASSKADCLVLTSGGKDSSFALCKVIELGLRPVVFTLDNGYLSQHALDNIQRMTERHNLHWERARPDHMATIFSDSLKRHSNVCNGCFKTIYTLATNYALEHNIPSIITGLSRGQLFETRLLDMVEADVFDIDAIDERVKQARIAYHQLNDAVSDHLDVSKTQQPDTFQQIEYFDFYRYCDASLSEMLEFLTRYGDWRRPPDTGRSTNCLINDVGIFVHKQERQHHNYAVPYAWDVRMGHKTRDQAVDELNDELDLIKVRDLLREIDYQPQATRNAQDAQLVAYVRSKDGHANSEALREALSRKLPEYALPTSWVFLDELPLTPSGKIDQRRLPQANRLEQRYVAPRNALEAKLAGLWCEVLQQDAVGRNDNFFDLGGDSIAAVQLSVAAAEQHILIDPTDCFEHTTIAELAAVATTDTDVGKPKEAMRAASGLNADQMQSLLKRVPRLKQ